MLTLNQTSGRTWAKNPTELKRLGTTVAHPAASARYRPLDHDVVARAFLDQLRTAGYEPQSQSYTLTRGGAACVGTVVCKARPDLGLPDGIAPSAGWVNQNTGKSSLKGAVGGSVRVCKNGMVIACGTGAQLVRRMHVGDVDLDAVLAGMVGAFKDSHLELAAQVARLQGTDLSNAQGDELLVQAGLDEVLPWRAVKVAAEQWRTPNHPEFQDRNAWSAYNAMTEALKVRAGDGQLDTLAKLGPWWDAKLAALN